MQHSDTWTVETRGLGKSYGDVHSLRDCDLQVPEGSIYGLLGPNGAGKTTLLRILLGFLRPSYGRGSVCGFDCARQSLHVRRCTSYLPGEARLYRSMRGRQVLELFSGLQTHGSLTRSLAIAQRLELDLTRRVMFMSTGMRQKLAIALVLGAEAPVTILDEPTANLDPSVRSEVLQLVRETRQQGRTVILSSHIFSDIESTCDMLGILRRGQLVFQQRLDALPELHILRADAPPACQLEPLRGLDFVDHAALLPSESSAPQQLELHLSGSPNRWLPWLSELRLQNLKIERAGIQALYQSYHHADTTLPPLDELPQEAVSP